MYRTLLFTWIFCLVNVSAAESYSEALVITPTSHPANFDKFYVCEYAGTERSISLNYARVPPLPCEVVYHREQEGKPFEILWQARFDEDFCEVKTSELLMQLKAAGWLCAES